MKVIIHMTKIVYQIFLGLSQFVWNEIVKTVTDFTFALRISQMHDSA